MAMPHHSPSSQVDAFLHVQTSRGGKLKGESEVRGHEGDIELVRWHWGVSAASALADQRAGALRSYTQLTVYKRIDMASTPLMSALVRNDEVTELRLTLRRAGGDPEPFYILTLKSARVVDLRQEVEDDATTLETVAFSFTEIEGEYRAQKASGQRGSSTSFNDRIA